MGGRQPEQWNEEEAERQEGRGRFPGPEAGAAFGAALGPLPDRPTRIVCIGGGTGLPAVLRGLVRFAAPSPGWPGLTLTAVVAVSDDGGSSGRLRRQAGILPPGDIRNCLVALSGGTRPLGRVFQHRFVRSGDPLNGHAVGNLVLAALAEASGDFLSAVRACGRLLGTRGAVLPCTLRPVTLRALLQDGRVVQGERNLRRARGRVCALQLEPAAPPPAPGVLSALRGADLVVLGPGSLYSSLLPNLLVGGVAEALRECGALRVMVGNLMAQPGETDGMDGADHVRAVQAHAGRVLDCIVVNSSLPPPPVLASYLRRGAAPLAYLSDQMLRLGAVPLRRDVLNVRGSKVRHDARKLAGVLLALARAARQQRCAGA